MYRCILDTLTFRCHTCLSRLPPRCHLLQRSRPHDPRFRSLPSAPSTTLAISTHTSSDVTTQSARRRLLVDGMTSRDITTELMRQHRLFIGARPKVAHAARLLMVDDSRGKTSWPIMSRKPTGQNLKLACNQGVYAPRNSDETGQRVVRGHSAL